MKHIYVTSFLHLSVKGTTGFEAQIDKCLELAEYLYNKIKNREGYEMVFDGKVCSATSFSPLVSSVHFITYWNATNRSDQTAWDRKQGPL